MSKEKKQEEKKRVKPKKSDNFVRNFLLTLFGFFIIVIFISKYEEKTVMNLPAKDEQSNEESGQNTNNYVPSLGEDIMSFAPDEMATEAMVASSADNVKIKEEKKEADTEHQSPYEQELDKEEKTKQQSLLDQQKSNDNFSNKINSYRLFLQNANKLVAKFYKGESSANELIIFNSIAHPLKVDAVVTLINEYNNFLAKTDSSSGDVVQNNFYQKILNRFVKIRKISEYEKAKKQLEEKISDILPIFVDYVYSQELLDNFVVNK